MDKNSSESAMDRFARFLKERIIVLGSPIDDSTANVAIAQMLMLADEDAMSDILLYINSAGGDVTSSLAIYDTMQQLSTAVRTIATGQAAGTAALLLCAGRNGKRYALPNARVAFCPLVGPSVDTDIERSEIERITELIIEITAHHTNQPPETIERDMNKGLILDPAEAQRYGIVDSVIESLEQICWRSID